MLAALTSPAAAAAAGRCGDAMELKLPDGSCDVAFRWVCGAAALRAAAAAVGWRPPPTAAGVAS